LLLVVPGRLGAGGAVVEALAGPAEPAPPDKGPGEAQLAMLANSPADTTKGATRNDPIPAHPDDLPMSL
jgi:hypothetical protein